MYKTTYLSILLISGGLFLSACGGQEEKKDEMATEQVAVINTTHAYICPMHCENGFSMEPGQCPVCGMDLVKNPDYKGSETVVDTTATVTPDTSGQSTQDDKPEGKHNH